jgi:hypothetical protein
MAQDLVKWWYEILVVVTGRVLIHSFLKKMTSQAFVNVNYLENLFASVFTD